MEELLRMARSEVWVSTNSAGWQTRAKDELPRPRRGRPDPKPVPELMEMPSKVTEGHLFKAQGILMCGSVAYLLESKRRQPLKDKLKPRWQKAWEAYVRLAVEKQWMIHAPEKLLDQCELLDESERGNKLYRRVMEDVPRYSRPGTRKLILYYVAYNCPSTGKLYVSSVPLEGAELQKSSEPWNYIGEYSADKAMGWKFGLRLKEYQQLKIEA